jgi:predicted nuclease of restriction endonuclease-like (RecB) superfamily
MANLTYQDLLKDIKGRIRQAQVKAARSANAEMLMLYWDIGRMIDERQSAEGWGSGVIPRLAKDIKNELTDVKGFSERNLKRMLAFHREYPHLRSIVAEPRRGVIVPPAVAQLTQGNDNSDISVSPPDMAKLPEAKSSIVPRAVAQLGNALKNSMLQVSWAHHVVLMEKIKDFSIRLWYMQQTIGQGWTRDHLISMIKTKAHARQGKSTTNFAAKLPAAQSALAEELLKDPYIFDFLTLEEVFHENELEADLVRHLEKFLLELGAGFAFVGRQYHIDIGEQDFYIDLLFYHLKLRCYVVVELKKGAFKPEYAGKLNFYCSVVDDLLRHEQDQQTIGLILCQSKNRILAEYSLRNIQKPIGVSEYDLTRALPNELKSSLPSIEEIEAELGFQSEW